MNQYGYVVERYAYPQEEQLPEIVWEQEPDTLEWKFTYTDSRGNKTYIWVKDHNVDSSSPRVVWEIEAFFRKADEVNGTDG